MLWTWPTVSLIRALSVHNTTCHMTIPSYRTKKTLPINLLIRRFVGNAHVWRGAVRRKMCCNLQFQLWFSFLKLHMTPLPPITPIENAPWNVLRAVLTPIIDTDPRTKIEMPCPVLYCTVLYCIVLYCIVLYCTISYRTDTDRTVSYLLYRTVRDAYTISRSIFSCLGARSDLLCCSFHYVEKITLDITLIQ